MRCSPLALQLALAMLFAACGEGSDGAESCDCNAFGSYDDKACFCEGIGYGCGDDVTIDRMLEPKCPGSVIHPISPSCKIGAVIYEDYEVEFITTRHYFDRDTSELVGISISTDTPDYCGGVQDTVSWGTTAASCEPCDPCGDEDSDLPPCAAPEDS